MRWDAEHRAIGMPEDYMAAARLTAHEPVSFRNRLKALDSPILGIGFHAGQRLSCFRHRGMILLVILCCKCAVRALPLDLVAKMRRFHAPEGR